jgi:hypothetical protein
MKPLPNQMHLDTVIDHRREPITYCNIMNTPDVRALEDTHKPAGVRLAKMLGQYDTRPSSELWSSIQSLARYILK